MVAMVVVLGMKLSAVVLGIDVGGSPSGPSIEGPFCRTVHLCRFADRKIEKKKQKKRKK